MQGSLGLEHLFAMEIDSHGERVEELSSSPRSRFLLEGSGVKDYQPLPSVFIRLVRLRVSWLHRRQADSVMK